MFGGSSGVINTKGYSNINIAAGYFTCIAEFDEDGTLLYTNSGTNISKALEANTKYVQFMTAGSNDYNYTITLS